MANAEAGSAQATMERFYTAEYEFMQAGGVEAGATFDEMAALIDPEAVMYQSPDLPWGGEYRGHTGWLEFFTNFIVHFESLEVSDPLMVGHGDKVMTRATLKTRSRGTGVELTYPMMHDITVKDGRIVSLRPYYWNVPQYVAADAAASAASQA